MRFLLAVLVTRDADDVSVAIISECGLHQCRSRVIEANIFTLYVFVLVVVALSGTGTVFMRCIEDERRHTSAIYL